MHHDTCATHVPWCISGSLTNGGRKNVLAIPGACATRNFTYLARGSYCLMLLLLSSVISSSSLEPFCFMSIYEYLLCVLYSVCVSWKGLGLFLWHWMNYNWVNRHRYSISFSLYLYVIIIFSNHIIIIIIISSLSLSLSSVIFVSMP